MDYDPIIIHQHAARLYAQARLIVLRYAALALLVSFVAASIASSILGGKGIGQGEILIIALVSGAVGASVGRDKSFALRLQAQTALCQAQIEANTGRTLALALESAPARASRS